MGYQVKSRNSPPSAHGAQRKWEAQRRHTHRPAPQKPRKPSTQHHGSLAHTFKGVWLKETCYLCICGPSATQKLKLATIPCAVFPLPAKPESHLLHPQMARSTTDITQQAISAPREARAIPCPFNKPEKSGLAQGAGRGKRARIFQAVFVPWEVFSPLCLLPVGFPWGPLSPRQHRVARQRGLLLCTAEHWHCCAVIEPLSILCSSTSTLQRAFSPGHGVLLRAGKARRLPCPVQKMLLSVCQAEEPRGFWKSSRTMT